MKSMPVLTLYGVGSYRTLWSMLGLILKYLNKIQWPYNVNNKL